MMLGLSFIGIFVLIHLVVAQESSQQPPEGGFLKREYSLSKPYSGNGMTIPYWDFGDNAIITNNFIQLTSDTQGQLGSIWSKLPCYVRDWEMHVHFKVYGSSRTLGADGLAIWYTDSRMTAGPVFGSRDEFSGLGVFLDTYKNGGQVVTFPQVTAMVGNGTTKYDHLEDGQTNSIGSCLGSFRNTKHDTIVGISYIKQRLIVKLDVDGEDNWKECINVPGVQLPTRYFFGASAATGDLADNHHVISIKFYELDVLRTPDEESEDWSKIKPGVFGKPPIDNRDDVGVGYFRNSSISGFKLFLIIVCALLGVAVCIIVGFVVFQKRQQHTRKRFY